MKEALHAQPKAAPPPSLTQAGGGVLQRKCACGGSVGAGECGQCDRRKLSLQRAASDSAFATPSAAEAPAIVHDVLRSPGQPLDTETRAFMEPRFGHDFSRVRVHTDERAAASAQAVHSLAYTVGNNMVFGKGRYEPHSATGQRLLAHELTHVVQQGGGSRDEEQVRRAPAEEMATDTASQAEPDANSRLRELISRVEGVHSAASQKLGATGAASAVDPGALEESQKYVDGLGILLNHLRDIAGGGDESLKQHVLEQFSQNNLAHADGRLRPRTQPAPTPVNIQEAPDQTLAAMSLEISHPRSGAEIEADRVAEQVVSGATVSVQHTGSLPGVYRQDGNAMVAAGTAILVFEASGPGEVEAAIPVVGWIALGATLLVAGVLIGTGALMSSSESAPRTQTRTQPRTGTGTRTRPRPEGNCNAMMTACMLTSLADQPGSVYGQSRCLFCAEVCRREGGVWPTIAPTTTATVRCDFWNFPGTE